MGFQVQTQTYEIDQVITQGLGHIAIGEKTQDWAGGYISRGGDVNGDGIDDFLISAPQADKDSPGKIYLLLGRLEWNSHSLSISNGSFVGEKAGDYAGQWVEAVGDLNKDGYDDIVISAPRNGEGGDGAGQTYLIYGRASPNFQLNLSLSEANASFIGESAYDFSGHGLD